MLENLDNYSAKGFRDKLKEHGIFYTDLKLANMMKDIAYSYVKDIKEVYDPTCGRGNLLSVFEDDVIKYGQDINGSELEFAKENIPNFNAYCENIFNEDGFKDKKFKVILGNPPFSVKWSLKDENDIRFKNLPKLPPPSKADYAFLIHILHKLEDDGVAVVLNFPGILYRGNREKVIRKWMVEQNYIDTVQMIKGGYFEDTKIATVLLILRKNKETTDIKFINEENKEKVVSFEEVKENDFTLSVENYIEKEVIREKIDIKELTCGALSTTTRRLYLNLMVDYLSKVMFDESPISKEKYIGYLEDIINRLIEVKNIWNKTDFENISIFDESRHIDNMEKILKLNT